MRVTFHHPHGFHAPTNEQELQARIEAVLGHLVERVTTMHVTLEDVNGGKSGPDDKQCKLEFHGPFDTLVVHANHSHMLGAVDAAANKAATALDRAMKKLMEHRRDVPRAQ